MTGLQLGKGALQRVVAERNVRSILFQLTPASAQRAFIQGPDVLSSLQALKTSPYYERLARNDPRHGYRLGLIGEALTADGTKPSVLSAFNLVHHDQPNGVSVYEYAARKLSVPLDRILLVTEPSLVDAGVANLTRFREMTPMFLPSQSLLSEFARELLNFEQCLDPAGRCFGPYRVLFSQVFYESSLSFALVNLKPIVPGHVLVVPKRPVARFEMLDADEVSNLWKAAQLVGKQLERHYGACSLTFAIQDGEAAGQTVKHVHIHVIPRFRQDFERNDDIYTEIEKHERNLHVDNDARTARSEAEMAAEATQLRALFP